MSKINEVVTDKIKNLSEPIFDRVVNTLVDRESDRRTAAIVKVLDKIDSAQREYNRIKPDQGPFFDIDGAQIDGSAQWTKATLVERNKLNEKITKMQAAIEKGLNGDMEQVYKFAN